MKTDSSSREKRLRDQARWSPQPKQETILARPEFELGFGGARGGGKSDAGIAWTGYDSEQPRLRGLVVRKNATDLGDWLIRVKEIFPRVRVVGNPPVLKFPGTGEAGQGATFFTGHLKDKKALDKYVGQNLQRLLVEELNLIPSEESYVKLLASMRSTIPGVPAQVFTTFNPDNVGHTWIKRRFGLSGIPRDPVITKDPKTGRKRIFVPATVEDNQVLMSNDPEYVRTLEGLPDGLREQWRWGSWDDPIIRGAYYTVDLAQMRRDGRLCDLPFFPELSVHTWWDIGGDTTVILFVQFVGDWIHIIDCYINDSLGFPFYLSKLQEFRETRGYNYGIHHFPHDLDRMEWGSGRNRKEVLELKNMDYEVGERPQSKQGAIDASRLLFPRLKIDQHKGAQLIDALINYRKEWIEDKQTFNEKPVHDWASHPSDAVQYIALSNLEAISPTKQPSEFKDRPKNEAGGPNRSQPSPEFGGASRFNYGEEE